MSLDFNYKAVNMDNFPDEVYGEVAYLNSTFQAIVWNLMAIRVQAITEDNLEEVWFRTQVWQKLSGGTVITAQDIKNAIGLTTNVSNESRASFFKGMRNYCERSYTSLEQELS